MIYYRHGLQVGATYGPASFERLLKYFPETKQINKTTAYVLGTISTIVCFILLVIALPIGCVSGVSYWLFKLFKLILTYLFKLINYFLPINTIF